MTTIDLLYRSNDWAVYIDAYMAEQRLCEATALARSAAAPVSGVLPAVCHAAKGSDGESASLAGPGWESDEEDEEAMSRQLAVLDGVGLLAKPCSCAQPIVQWNGYRRRLTAHCVKCGRNLPVKDRKFEEVAA